MPGFAFAESVPHGTIVFTDDIWSLEADAPSTASVATASEASVSTSAASGTTEQPAAQGDDQNQSASQPSSQGTAKSSAQAAVAGEGASSNPEPPAFTNSAAVTGSKATTSPDSSELASVASNDSADRAYDMGSIVVEVAPNSSRESLDGIIAVAQASGLSVSASGVSQTDLDFGIVRLTLDDGCDPTHALSTIAKISGIISAQYNYLYTTLGTLEEVLDAPSASAKSGSASLVAQAYTQVNDKLTNEGWATEAVHIREAWDIAKANGSVAIAIIDTGVELDHPDLKDRIVASYNSRDPEKSANDTVGHGTHVAGIAAGTANNAVGIAGSSYDASIVAIKASAEGSHSFETSAIVRAFEWLLSSYGEGETVAEHYKVRVINLSVGGKDASLSANSFDDRIVAMMRKAHEAGILTVVAAGNKGTADDPYLVYPGDSEYCLSVMNLKRKVDTSGGGEDSGEIVNEGSSTPKQLANAHASSTLGYELSETSNYNVSGTRYKDLAAPGSSIESTYTQGRYARMSGTSMATPLVSGVAALMFAANPSLSPELVMALLEQSCADLGESGWDETYGYGMIDAAAAVRLALGSSIVGPSVVGVGRSSSAYEVAGGTIQADASGWTWSVRSYDGIGAAELTDSGELYGITAGEVELRASCTATTGATISVTRVVRVVDGAIAGSSDLTAGQDAQFSLASAQEAPDAGSGAELADAAALDLSSLGWAWFIDGPSSLATVDAHGIVSAHAAGVVTLHAVSVSDFKLMYSKRLTIA